MMESMYAYIVSQIAIVNGTIWQVIVRRLVERIQSREIDSFRRSGPGIVVDHDIHHKILRHG